MKKTPEKTQEQRNAEVQAVANRQCAVMFPPFRLSNPHDLMRIALQPRT